MRSTVTLAAVLAVAPLVIGAELERFGTTYTSGTISSEDILLHRTMVTATAIPGQIQTQDVNYNNIDVMVTAIIARQISAQDCSVRLVSAGVGWTGADLQFRSEVGHGYSYQLEVWGQIRRR